MANSKRSAADRSGRVNIIGASARAAVFSALRGGLNPVACDLFGDADLVAVAPFVELRAEYPDGLEDALSCMADAPFLYTGGLENHPELLTRCSRVRPLLGNGGRTLRIARDPELLREVSRAAGASPPELRRGDDPPTERKGWLLKPLRGAGGRGIRPATRKAPGDASDWYFQRRAAGSRCSSLHVASRSGCALLGITRQLVGLRWLHAPAHAWCGSIGPIALPSHAVGTLETAAAEIARACGLRGLFGIDFILDGERVQPIELNPRYTGSAEILEHAMGFSAVLRHVEACRGRAAREEATAQPGGEMLGKAVLFADRDVRAAPGLLRRRKLDPARFPELADIPRRGSRIARGRPIITVFARARSERACLEALREAAARARREFR